LRGLGKGENRFWDNLMRNKDKVEHPPNTPNTFLGAINIRREKG
jgi:hypothetical protein